MCHSNLDMRQAAMNRQGTGEPIPILYITELVGLALGIDPKILGLQRHYVSTQGLLQGTALAEVG
jgi:heterodisulfide reductase subunit B